MTFGNQSPRSMSTAGSTSSLGVNADGWWELRFGIGATGNLAAGDSARYTGRGGDAAPTLRDVLLFKT